MAIDNPSANPMQDDNAERPKKTSRRGFASMDPALQRAIAAEGGRAAHASGRGHKFTSEEARAAGKKSHSGRARANAGDSGLNPNADTPRSEMSKS